MTPMAAEKTRVSAIRVIDINELGIALLDAAWFREICLCDGFIHPILRFHRRVTSEYSGLFGSKLACADWWQAQGHPPIDEQLLKPYGPPVQDKKKSRMLFGDAKASLNALVAAVKACNISVVF